jgi:hypothetical protein
VAQLESKIQETVAIKEELQRQYASLEDNLKKVEAEKTVGGLCIYLAYSSLTTGHHAAAVCNRKLFQTAGFDSVLWR